MSTRQAAASERRCAVTGCRLADGSPMTLICEQAPNDGPIVLYPHGIEGHGVVLDATQQRVLARWLLNREPTLPPHSSSLDQSGGRTASGRDSIRWPEGSYTNSL